MITTKLLTKVICDMGGCREVAQYGFREGESLRTQINLCPKCMRTLYGEIGKLVVPKPIENIISKRIKQKKEENDER